MKIKNILFIIPKHLLIRNNISTNPYGILSLISYIRKEYYNIKLVDLNIEEDVKSTIIDFKPDYICISALFDSDFSHLKYMIPLIKEFYEGILVVGGGLATNNYKLLLKEIPEIDAICYGEGEIPLKELLEGDMSSPAWISKKSLEMGIIPRAEFIEDLDEIPIIDYNYIDIKKYNSRFPMLTDTFNKDKENKIEMIIHTSRGCPFNCVFCSNSSIHGKKIRYMSVDRIREIIKYYIDNYGMNVLLIDDDNFLLKKERALEILKIIKDFNISVDFSNGVMVSAIDDDISKAFYENGIKSIVLPFESGSDYVLKEIIQKPLKKKQIYEAVKSLKKYNIRIHAFIVIGLPNEFDEHRKETLDMLIDLDIDWVHIFIAIPVTGSRLYEICKTKGYLLSESYDNFNTSKCNIKAPGVEPEKIEEYAFYMNMVVNYITNSNYKNKNYDACLPYFLDVVKRYPNNPVVHYMLYKTLIGKDEFWNSMFKKFKEDKLI